MRNNTAVVVTKNDLDLMLNYLAKEMLSIPHAERLPKGSEYRSMARVFQTYSREEAATGG